MATNVDKEPHIANDKVVRNNVPQDSNEKEVDTLVSKLAESVKSSLEAFAAKIPKSVTKPTEKYLDFPSIHKPSVNYKRNSQTFAYRLSELVFGSLLAAYVLGFVSVVFTLVQSKNSGGTYFFLLSFWRASDWLTMVTCVQYLLNSVTFSVLTAFFYFTYQQSVLHLDNDYRKSYLDFVWAGAVGVLFGITMVFPYTSLSVFGAMILGAIFYKSKRFKEFWKIISGAVAGLQPGGSDSVLTDNALRLITEELNELGKSNDADFMIIKSWLPEADWKSKWGGVALLAAGCIIVLVPWGFELEPNSRWLFPSQLILIHCFLSGVLLWLIFQQLAEAASIMPYKVIADGREDALDEAFKKVLEGAQKKFKPQTTVGGAQQ